VVRTIKFPNGWGPHPKVDFALENAEEFVEQVGGQEAGEFAGVEGRGDFDQVTADDIEAAEGTDELEDLDAGEATYLRGAGAGGIGGVYGIDVEGDVDRLVAEGLQVALHLRHSLLVEFFSGDHADFVFAGEIEIVFAIDLAAQADLQDAAVL